MQPLAWIVYINKIIAYKIRNKKLLYEIFESCFVFEKTVWFFVSVAVTPSQNFAFISKMQHLTWIFYINNILAHDIKNKKFWYIIMEFCLVLEKMTLEVDGLNFVLHHYRILHLSRKCKIWHEFFIETKLLRMKLPTKNFSTKSWYLD